MMLVHVTAKAISWMNECWFAILCAAMASADIYSKMHAGGIDQVATAILIEGMEMGG